MKARERFCRIAMADSGSERQAVISLVNHREASHARDVDQRREMPVLLGDPQPDVGRAGDEHRARILGVNFCQLVGRALSTLRLAMRKMQHRTTVDPVERLHRRRRIGLARTRSPSRLDPRIDDRPVARAAAEISGKPVLDRPPVGQLALEPTSIELHDEARRAKTALGTVVIDQRPCPGCSEPSAASIRPGSAGARQPDKLDAGIDDHSCLSPPSPCPTEAHRAAPQSPSVASLLVAHRCRSCRRRYSSTVSVGGHVRERALRLTEEETVPSSSASR